jgi:DegV family protein with EDD domain
VIRQKNKNSTGEKKMSIRIIVDSACDIAPEMAKELQVQLIPLRTRFGEEEYLDGANMSHEEFFKKLIETDEFPQTSQVSPFEYGEIFKEVKAAGDQAVCITLSSKLSGCYQSALLAAEDYTDTIVVVDSLNACIGERLLTLLAVRLRGEGAGLQAIADKLNEEKKNIRLIALLNTLEYLKKGGRISSTTALVGNMLSIKPVIAIEEGEVKMVGKARGSKNGNNLITELIEKEGGIDFDMPYCLAYSGLDDGLLQKYVNDNERLFGENCTKEELPVSSIGAAIGTHIGPGAIAAAFFKK